MLQVRTRTIHPLWPQGLIRLNEPQHPNVKEYQTCQRLYNATLALLSSKEPVKEVR